MDMMDWAKNEVRIAMTRELGGIDPDDKAAYELNDRDALYAAGCYDSALKAYRSLMEDGHSGMSMHITKDILDKLLSGQPLTPIYDVPNIWKEMPGDENRNEIVYQCIRMPSLFKRIYPDGSVRYSDFGRFYGVDPDDENQIAFSGCGMGKLMDEYFPITMPYSPEVGKYKIEVKEYLSDRDNGDFDTLKFVNIVTPTGKIVPVDRCFAVDGNGMREISGLDFLKRYEMHILRETAEEALKKRERSSETDPDQV